MAFTQLTYRKGLRDIEACLGSTRGIAGMRAAAVIKPRGESL
jgi:hypothetical protein